MFTLSCFFSNVRYCAAIVLHPPTATSCCRHDAILHVTLLGVDLGVVGLLCIGAVVHHLWQLLTQVSAQGGIHLLPDAKPDVTHLSWMVRRARQTMVSIKF